jgi:hypothetical protein
MKGDGSLSHEMKWITELFKDTNIKIAFHIYSTAQKLLYGK